jgi:RYK receptor-like tyrosine kinase
MCLCKSLTFYFSNSDPSENSVDDPLLLETLTAPPSTLFTLIVGGILAILLVIILIIVAYCAHGPSSKRNPHPPVRTSSFQRLPVSPPSLAPSIISPPSIAATGMSTLPYTLPYKKGGSESGEELYKRIGELTVQRCRIRLSNLLQEGTFGRIYRGTYNDNQDVLVKTVVQHASQTQVSLLLTEGMSLYGASHVSILSVLGVSIDDHTAPFLLYPASENMRNLKMFLQEPAARKLTTIQIVKMATQLVQALGHLHSHGVIHKDVGARNCV